MQLWLHCKNGQESLTHADLIWSLKPFIEGAIRGVKDSGTPIPTRAAKPPKGMIQALDKRSLNLFDPKGYANRPQVLAALENHIKVLRKAKIEKSVLGIDN